MDCDGDYALALQLQEQFDKESGENSLPTNCEILDLVDNADLTQTSSCINPSTLCDSKWELIDPNPDARGLFLEFNDKYFWGKLNSVEVKWSPRMTLCAGLCQYEGRGGLCVIKLSEPLLKLRPRRDLVETLLHEMIHAYLFVTNNDRDREGHGPEFQKHMNRINAQTDAKITIYHSFHDEVDVYRQHWWRCTGPCQQRRPYFGYVKRAMNRPPSSRDPWWAEHQQTCGGVYVKIREPEGFGTKQNSASVSGKGKASDNQPKNTLDRWIPGASTSKSNQSTGSHIKLGTSATPPASISKPSDEFDSASDSELVFAIDSLETVQQSDKARNVNAQLKTNDGHIHRFPGSGFVLGASNIQSNNSAAVSDRNEVKIGSVVRRIPGFGLIAERAGVSSSSTSAAATIRELSRNIKYIDSTQTAGRETKTAIGQRADGIRNVSTGEDRIKVCDKRSFSDSDDGFDAMLEDYSQKRKRRRRKFSADEFKTNIFGSRNASIGSVVRVKNLVSVNNRKSKVNKKATATVTSRNDSSRAAGPLKRNRIDEENCGTRLGTKSSRKDGDAAVGHSPPPFPTMWSWVESSSNKRSVISEDVDRNVEDVVSRDGCVAGTIPVSATSSSVPVTIVDDSPHRVANGDLNAVDAPESSVSCPVCQLTVDIADINVHLDQCLM